jgi:hypothetical protein
VGNSTRNYPYRIYGNFSGCIGEDGDGESDCEKIPSDWDLHTAVLLLIEDFNNDSIIDVQDLEPAIKKIGDLNQDGSIDIYDIDYPKKIQHTNAIINPSIIKDDQVTSYNLMGKISIDGKKIILNYPIDIVFPNMGDGNEENLIDKRAEIFLSVGSEIVVYRNKIVVIKGKIVSGNTQSYADGFLFVVEDILGVVK